jgi:ribosome-binding protein aMBF1 (putative translation factor)
MCCKSVTFREKCADPQLAVKGTQRNLNRTISVILKLKSLSGGKVSVSFRSEAQETRTQEFLDVATSSPAFKRELAARIGSRVAMRRSLCGLSKLQLAARLGIDIADVSSYELGEKRISCKLLLEAAKQLKATPRFFFQ